MILILSSSSEQGETVLLYPDRILSWAGEGDAGRIRELEEIWGKVVYHEYVDGGKRESGRHNWNFIEITA